MSVEYLISNPGKREYLVIEAFGDDFRRPVGCGVFNKDSYLHAYAVAYLCTGGPGGDYRARWMGDTVVYVPDADEENYLDALDHCTDITIPVLGELCEEDDFLEEIILRASKEETWLPITSRLCRLIDDTAFETLQSSAKWHFGERWPDVMQSLRARRSASEATINRYENGSNRVLGSD